MKTRAFSFLSVLCLVLGLLADGQERRPWTAEKPAEPAESQSGPGGIDPVAWERDFDLLLEVRNIPTKGELVAAARLQALTQERDGEQAKLEDVKKRLARLQGTYSTEVLLNEMLQLDVKDFQSVQTKLEEEAKAHRKRLLEIEDQLKHLKPTGG